MSPLLTMTATAAALVGAVAGAAVGASVIAQRAQQERDELRESLAAAQLAAGTDALTGLPNRSRFEAYGQAQLATEKPLAVVLLDLDDFKPVNDHYGHHVGDRVLTVFAQRLALVMQPYGMAARLGGDEFAAIMHIPAGEDPETWTNAVLSGAVPVLSSAMDMPGLAAEPVRVNVSIGAAWTTPEVADLAVPLFTADKAMYTAKEAAKHLATPADSVVARRSLQNIPIVRDDSRLRDVRRAEKAVAA